MSDTDKNQKELAGDSERRAAESKMKGRRGLQTAQRWRKLSAFINAPASLAVLGFGLTTILGTILTDNWHVAEKSQEDSLTTVEREAADLNKAIDEINKTIVEREIVSDALIDSLQRKQPVSEVDRLWLQYTTAYSYENAAAFRGHLPLEGISDESLVRGKIETPVFWRYLDLVVQPRFRDLHDCIVRLRQTYAEPASTPELMSSSFQHCDDQRKSASGHYFWDLYRAPANGVREWGFFQQCIENFTYHLKLFATIRRAAKLEELREDQLKARWFDWLVPGQDAATDETNPRVLEDHFLARLQSELSQNCGQPTPGGKEE